MNKYKVGDLVWWRGENDSHQQVVIVEVEPNNKYLIRYTTTTERRNATGEIVYDTTEHKIVVDQEDLRDQVFQF